MPYLVPANDPRCDVCAGRQQVEYMCESCVEKLQQEHAASYGEKPSFWGLHQPDESFGVYSIAKQVCNVCGSQAACVVLTDPHKPVWTCEEHAVPLSQEGHQVWVIRQTCQLIGTEGQPCGASADSLQVVSTQGKVQPASYCLDHAAEWLT